MANKLLIHIHLYYTEQTDFFLKELSNVSVPFDLIVTLTHEDSDVSSKISAQVPNAQFLVVENCGYDVYPFFLAMGKYDLNEYDYILKIHTKNCNTSPSLNHIHYHGNGFRNGLITPLLGSEYNFKKAFKRISFPKTGIVCSKNFLIKQESATNNATTELLCEKYSVPYKKDYVFCAGTMFLCRSEIIKKILEKKYTAEDFRSNLKTGDSGTLAHSMETLFGIICHNMGYKIQGVHSWTTFKDFLRIILKSIVHKDIRWLIFY